MKGALKGAKQKPLTRALLGKEHFLEGVLRRGLWWCRALLDRETFLFGPWVSLGIPEVALGLSVFLLGS